MNWGNADKLQKKKVVLTESSTAEKYISKTVAKRTLGDDDVPVPGCGF